MVVGESFVFVHVPKTGGTSITEALGGRTARASLHRQARVVGMTAGKPAFGFVRNPWDWRVSLYAYTKPGESFLDWLFAGAFFLRDDIRSDSLQPMQRRSQMHWLDDCERVGRFERLTDDFTAITAELGIVAKPLEHLNGSNRRDYREFYTPEAVDFVARHAAPEIGRFGYRF